MMMSGITQEYALAARDAAAKREFWASLALRESPNIGMRRMAALLAHFGSAYDAIQSVNAWRDAGIPEGCAASFKKETWRQKAGLEWAAAKGSSCGILLWGDAEYPVWLRSIPDPPPFLYFLGDIALLHNVAVAVVGMRSCSEEGLNATVHIARGLSRAGLTIVSGMARGIDRAAHLAGLEGPGSSIGVLGAGIDVIYPQGNGDLYSMMGDKGLLVSEYPPAYRVDAKSFPVRNRIISGLSRAVVVVEAALRSGSLNTANHALEQNRELMAVPGPVSAASAKGCQELVRRGAKPVFCADDVLHELIPFLTAHVQQELKERDVTRFQYPRPEKIEDVLPDALSLPTGLLPWRATGSDGKKKGQTGKASFQIQKETVSDIPTSEPDTPPDRPTLTGLEGQILTLVNSEPLHIDDICRILGQNAETVSRIVLLLEIQGFLTRLPGMRYVAR